MECLVRDIIDILLRMIIYKKIPKLSSSFPINDRVSPLYPPSQTKVSRFSWHTF